jgi:hypothetical protein
MILDRGERPHRSASDTQDRLFDIPWIVLDAARTRAIWNWQPRRSLSSILAEIADHAEKNPNWPERTID